MIALKLRFDLAGHSWKGRVSDRISSLLISGTSHTGKSTLASSIGETFGWSVLSTDQLARHPGRPWPKVPPHNAEYYSCLSAKTIYQFLLQHHENMWPNIRRLISENRDKGVPFVLEGSALRPEYIVTQASRKTATVCLYSDQDFLRVRMRKQSCYDHLDESHRAIVDKFIDRSLRDNDENLAAARSLGLQCIDVRDTDAVEQFRAALTNLVNS